MNVTPDQITAATVREYAIRYDRATCERCGGTGETPYAWVEGGLCFGCQGGGRVLTPAGREARARINALMDQTMGVPVSALVDGDRMWVEGRWREIVWIKRREGSVGVVDGRPHRFADSATIRLRGRRPAFVYEASTSTRRFNPDAMAAVLREAVALDGVEVFAKRATPLLFVVQVGIL